MGSNTIGIPLLVVMAIALIAYCVWRFWEAITGQGADAAFGNLKNFFRYRLSPFVSGIVYALYTVFVISLIPKSREGRQSQNSSGFPDSWTHSDAGKTGLAFAGIAFCAGGQPRPLQGLDCRSEVVLQCVRCCARHPTWTSSSSHRGSLCLLHGFSSQPIRVRQSLCTGSARLLQMCCLLHWCGCANQARTCCPPSVLDIRCGWWPV